MSNDIANEAMALVGSSGRYQLLMATLMFLIGIAADLVHAGLPLLETVPIVNVTTPSGYKHMQMNYTLCNENYEINTDLTKHSWVVDYGLYCDKLKVSLIGVLYVLGGVCGTLVNYFLKNLKAKLPITYVCVLMSLAYAAILVKNIYVLYASLFIVGFCNIIIFIMKMHVTVDMTDTHNRAYFANFVLSGGQFTVMLMYSLFDLNVDWDFLYLATSIFTFLLIGIFFDAYVESPNYFRSKGRYEEMMTSYAYIAKFNKGNTIKESHIKTELDHLYGFLKPQQEEADILLGKNEVTSPPERNSAPGGINKLLATNFLISSPLISSLYFFYNLQSKKYSYSMEGYIYLFTLLSIISMLLMSPLMNFFGRKKTKISLLAAFLGLNFVSLSIPMSTTVLVNIYLASRVILHCAVTVNFTHFNESFAPKDRVLFFGLNFTIDKFLVLFWLFVTEYFPLALINTYIFAACVLIIFLFLFQKETA